MEFYYYGMAPRIAFRYQLDIIWCVIVATMTVTCCQNGVSFNRLAEFVLDVPEYQLTGVELLGIARLEHNANIQPVQKIKNNRHNGMMAMNL